MEKDRKERECLKQITLENGDKVELVQNTSEDPSALDTIVINYVNGDVYTGEFGKKQKQGKGEYRFGNRDLTEADSDLDLESVPNNLVGIGSGSGDLDLNKSGNCLYGKATSFQSIIIY